MTLKIDPMRHRKPGFIGLSWRAHRVFDMLLCVSENFNLKGKITPEFWFSGFLIAEFGITAADVNNPADWLNGGLAELVGSGVVEKLPGDNASIFLPGSSKPRVKTPEENPIRHAIAEMWNAFAPANGLTSALRMNEKRVIHANAVLRDWKINELDAALSKLRVSDFLMGKNDRGWKADFDWFIRPGTISKILEGKYDNKGQTEIKLVTPTKDLYA